MKLRSLRSLVVPSLLALASVAPLAGALTSSPGPDRAIRPYMLGMNGNMLSMPDAWSRPEMIEAFRRLHADLFRYPAGTLANTWDWDRGWLDADVPSEDLIDWVRAFDRGPQARQRYPIEEAAKMHRGTGATIVFVLNMLTRDLEHSLRGLRRARDLGIPVRYVEMGNELFFNLPLESRVFPTPEDYGRESARWIEAIKREFPGVKCGIVAGGRAGHARSDRWTQRALDHCPNADAIIVHTYTPSGLTGRERRDITAGTEGTTAATNLPPAERQAREMALLRTREGAAKMMATAYAASQRARAYPRRPDQEVWLTEWNLRGDGDAVRGTWANTLFVLSFYHGMLGYPAVTLSHFHNLIGPNFAALHTGANELRHVAGLSVPTEPFWPTAGGLATALLGRVATGQTVASEIIFPDAVRLGDETPALPGVWGWTFTGPRGVTGLLVNLTADSATVRRPARWTVESRLEVLAAPLDRYIANRDSVASSLLAAGDELTLPPYSVVLALAP